MIDKEQEKRNQSNMEIDKIYLGDCIEIIGNCMEDKSVDCVLTDIPYNECNRADNGLRNLNKSKADIGEFDLKELTSLLCDKTKGSIYMFCGINQVSEIRKTMTAKGLSTRVIVWEKTNPSPMNGNVIWLSGIELCVFGKKKGATFNYHCRNTVLRYPCGSRKYHPTQKPVNMFQELILASTKEGDVILDPFIGSGTTAIAAIREKRHFIGMELNKEYYDIAIKRVKDELNNLTLS